MITLKTAYVVVATIFMVLAIFILFIYISRKKEWPAERKRIYQILFICLVVSCMFFNLVIAENIGSVLLNAISLLVGLLAMAGTDRFFSDKISLSIILKQKEIIDEQNSLISQLKGFCGETPRGTLISVFCGEFTKYGRYADGFGGTYEDTIEENSPDCNYVVSPTYEVRVIDEQRTAIEDLMQMQESKEMK